MVKKFLEISIVTPCFNEEDNVEICALKLREAMRNYLPKVSYEHIFVDNNSTDKTFKILTKLAKRDKNIKVIRNSRNVGSFNNTWIGMKYCTGKYVVPSLAADLQDPPDHIPKMYRLLKKANVLMVYGVMENREEKIFMKKMREMYYSLVNFASPIDIPRNSGEFLIADARLVKSVLETEDKYPYIRGLFAQAQVNAKPIYYKRILRKRGKSGENLVSLINHALNGFISTTRAFPRIILAFGLLVSISSIFMAIINLLIFATKHNSSVQSGVPTLLISVFFFSGIQLLFLGIATEYIQAIYRQVRPIPLSFPVDKINIK
jgi:glycosyltransferase involved in cell wall biosynthesis